MGNKKSRRRNGGIERSRAQRRKRRVINIAIRDGLRVYMHVHSFGCHVPRSDTRRSHGSILLSFVTSQDPRVSVR